MPNGSAARPEGFTYEVRKSGDVVISHHGRSAAVLRGAMAVKFLSDLDRADGRDQDLMARLTGNFRRGNERAASQHPRNR